MVTGISGAGKTQALHIMEDMDYYCIDNLPPVLIETFLDLSACNTNLNIEKIAVGIDIRSAKQFTGIKKIIQNLRENNIISEVLFLDAEDDTIINRFKETRRIHPLARNGNLQEGISEERDIIQKSEHTMKVEIDLCFTNNSTDFYFKFDLYKCFISSRNLPAPRTTQGSGFSAWITGTSVS